MDVKGSSKAARSEATRKALLEVAGRLFTERGFAETPTEDIVHAAGVTRGALYHHFRDKADLFRAYAEEGEVELVQRITAAADVAGTDPWDRLHAGAQALLDSCLDPRVQRCLLEAPTVLGWETWRDIRTRRTFELLKAALDGAMQAGAIRRQPVQPLAQLLFGALHEAAMAIARTPEQAARDEVGQTLTGLLESLKP